MAEVENMMIFHAVLVFYEHWAKKYNSSMYSELYILTHFQKKVRIDDVNKCFKKIMGNSIVRVVFQEYRSTLVYFV